MLLESCNGLIRALGADVGIPDLALDEAHCCTLAFDSIVVNFELDESSDQLFLYASLGPIPAAGSRVFEELLEGNLLWKDTGERRSASTARATGSCSTKACLPSACPKSPLMRRSSGLSTWRKFGPSG